MASIPCPCCQRLLDAPAGCAGLAVQCALCQHTFTAPAAAPTPAALTPPPADEAEAPERFKRPLPGHRGGAVLAGGILSLLLLPGAAAHSLVALPALLLGGAAWRAGSADLRAQRAGLMDPRGAGLLRAGRWLGLAGALLAVAWLASRAL